MEHSEYRTCKVCLYPSVKQIAQIETTIKACREVNKYVSLEIVRNGMMSAFLLQKHMVQLKDQHPEWRRADSQALTYECRKVAYNYMAIYHASDPSNSNVYKESYTTTQVASINVDDTHIKLPKLGRVRYRGTNRVTGSIKGVVVIKDHDRFFASIIYKKESDLTDFDDGHVIIITALDFKVNGLFVNESGYQPFMPEFFIADEKKIAKIRSRLMRMKEGSLHYQETVLKLKKAEEHVASKRKDFLHKLSRDMVEKYDTIIIENLSIQRMVSNHYDNKYHKKLYNKAWKQFVEMLSYKLSDKGRKLIMIEKDFPSTKLCSVCGYLNHEIDNDSIRTWECPSCHTLHNRDMNAAMNIYKHGIKMIYQPSLGK